MKSLGLIVLLTLVQFACSTSAESTEWVTVGADQAGFSVECPPKASIEDQISAKYDASGKTGYLHCVVGKVRIFVHSSEWAAAEDPKENSERFYESLPARGVGELKEIALGHQPGKAMQSYDAEFQTIGRHFVIDKTAYHLHVSFNEGRAEAVGFEQLEAWKKQTAERFFRSFKLTPNKP